MKNLLPALLFVACCLGSQHAQANPIGPKPGELVTMHGFQLSATADAAEYAVCTPITIDTEAKNVTDDSLPIAVSSFFLSYQIEVKTESRVATGNNVVMPLTLYGQRLEKNKHTNFGQGPTEILPGKSYPQTFILNQIYDMTEPGDYIVTISRNINFVDFMTKKSTMQVTSNVLHITVR